MVVINKKLKYISIISGSVLTAMLMKHAYFSYKGRKAWPAITDQIYNWRFGQIRYRVKGHGEPLLLIHGIYPGADMSEWDKIDTSIYHTYRVYTLDLLGFGHSEKPDISYSSYMYTCLVNDFIEDIIKSPTIVAASDYSAAYTVMGYIFNPRYYKKMILISPAGIVDGYQLPAVKDLFVKWILRAPIISDIAYIILTRRKTANSLFNNLRDKKLISSQMPHKISPSAFVGGSNAKYPICELLTKYLNVKIKNKMNKIKIPMLILTRESSDLRKMSSRVKGFLEL